MIDYSNYSITSTSQFDNGLAQLRSEGNIKEIQKLFHLIDEIIQGVDMYEKEYARPLKNSEKMQHIHLDGRRTGDIIFIYKVDGHEIDLDLRLYNVTDHKNLDRVSNPKFTHKQALHEFDVVANKYSSIQMDYAQACYFELISDYKFHQCKGQLRQQYSDNYLHTYFNNAQCEDPLTFDEFTEIIHYLEHKYRKSIFGALNFNSPQSTFPITSREESYIMNLFAEYEIDIYDAYIETEVDEYDDTYEYMCVVTNSDSYQLIKLLECELYSLDSLFGIIFESTPNGLGRCGRTYEFSHYFE